MTNNDFIREYIRGERSAAAYCHLGYCGNILINYSTALCEINRAEHTAVVNVRKYSTTTSKIQNRLLYELEAAGFQIEKVEGEPARYWNYGYMGAPNLTTADVRRMI